MTFVPFDPLDPSPTLNPDGSTLTPQNNWRF